MKTIFLKSLFTIVCISIGFFSFAQNAWSLEDCIQHALENNITIKQYQLNEKSGQHDLHQSYANYLPVISANGSHGYSFGRSVDPFTNEFSTERILRQDVNLSSSVTLFSGFQNLNYLRMNMHRNTALRFDTEQAQNDILLNIVAAYMQILYNEDFVETTQQQLGIIEQQLERTQALFQGGTLPRGSVLEIEARLAEEQLNVINAQNNLRLSYLELVQLLDLDPEKDFAIERPEISLVSEFNLHDASHVFAKAVQSEPSVQAARARISMNEKQISLAKGRYSPTLNLEASVMTGYSEAAMQFAGFEDLGSVEVGYTQDNVPVFSNMQRELFEAKPYSNQMRDNLSQYVGLRIRIPIFSRLDSYTRVQHARVGYEQSRNQYELVRNNLNKLIFQAHADANAALQKHTATLKSKEAFKESYHYALQRFELGMISPLEYNEALNRLSRAQTDVIQSKYEYVFKVKILEFYTGAPLRF